MEEEGKRKEERRRDGMPWVWKPSMATGRMQLTYSKGKPSPYQMGSKKVFKYLQMWFMEFSASCSLMSDPLWPMDYTVHGILQARKLEWVAFPFSRGSSNPGNELGSSALQADSLPSESPGKPITLYFQIKNLLFSFCNSKVINDVYLYFSSFA